MLKNNLKKLGEIADIKSGSTPSRSEHERYFKGGTIPWVKTMDLNNNFIYKTDELITKIAIEETSCSIFPKGTILVAMYGGFNQIGRTGLLKIDAAVNQAISAIKLDEKIAIPEYILQYLNGKVNYWKTFAASSRKDPNITRKDVCDFPIILPKIKEQKKIAEILTTWDEAIALTEKAINSQKQLKKALMQKLLSGKQRFQKFQFNKWDTIKLGQVAEIRRGASPRPIDNPNYFSENGRGWVRIADVTASKTYLTKTTQYLSELGESKSVFVDPGDLIMSICATIGVPRILNMRACVHDGFVVIRPKLNNFDRLFLYHFLDFISLRLAGSGQPGTQKNLNTTIVSEIKIPAISIEEQNEIAAFLSLADDQIYKLEEKLLKFQNQKRGLMQKLLTGEWLVPVTETND